MKQKMLNGKNVNLRLVEEGDLPLLARWRNDPENWRWFFNKAPIRLAAQRRWYEDLLSNKSKMLFAICKLSGQLIGTIGVDHIDFINQNAEFGNMLIGRAESQRKGFAGEAAGLLIDFCFNHLNLHRLYLYAYEDHAGAIRLYEQCGFKSEGVLRDAQFSEGRFRNVVLMSLLRKEPSKRQG